MCYRGGRPQALCESTMKRQTQQLIYWLNIIPISAMSLFWIGPTLQFWLAVAGPLLPFGVTPPSQPSMLGFLFWFGVCFVPLRLPPAYYQPRPFELRSTFYERLGVRVFRRVATNGDLINMLIRRHAPTYRVVRSSTSLDEYCARTYYGEKWHLVLLLMGMITTIYAAYIGWFATALFLTTTNIVFNLYPVLLQRYTRVRIAKMMAQHQSS